MLLLLGAVYLICKNGDMSMQAKKDGDQIIQLKQSNAVALADCNRYRSEIASLQVEKHQKSLEYDQLARKSALTESTIQALQSELQVFRQLDQKKSKSAAIIERLQQSVKLKKREVDVAKIEAAAELNKTQAAQIQDLRNTFAECQALLFGIAQQQIGNAVEARQSKSTVVKADYVTQSGA